MSKRLRILLVDDIAERAQLLERALREADHDIIGHIHPGDDVAHAVERLNPDAIIIDVDSPDRDTLEGMHTITKQRPKPIVMFTNNDDTALMHEALLAGVSAYVVDGLSSKRILPILKTAMLRFAAYESLRRELEEARMALTDRKIIERAKGLIMQQRGLSEDSAYRLLRKEAMNKNVKLADLARGIVTAMELLG